MPVAPLNGMPTRKLRRPSPTSSPRPTRPRLARPAAGARGAARPSAGPGRGWREAFGSWPAERAPGYLGSNKLAKKVALVSGGATPLGSLVATLFAREGADVALISGGAGGGSLRAAREAAAETLRAIEAEGRRGLVLEGEPTDPGFCAAAVAQVIGEFGRLDLVVHHCEPPPAARSLEEIGPERWSRTIHEALDGFYLLARAALPHLRRGAVILSSGSLAAIRGSASCPDFAAAQGAVHAFTRSLAKALRPRGIRVNCVAPPADAVTRQPESVAPAFVFLASECDSGLISGDVLPLSSSEDLS